MSTTFLGFNQTSFFSWTMLALPSILTDTSQVAFLVYKENVWPPSSHHSLKLWLNLAFYTSEAWVIFSRTIVFFDCFTFLFQQDWKLVFFGELCFTKKWNWLLRASQWISGKYKPTNSFEIWPQGCADRHQGRPPFWLRNAPFPASWHRLRVCWVQIHPQ